jgi:hypothetical protein
LITHTNELSYIQHCKASKSDSKTRGDFIPREGVSGVFLLTIDDTHVTLLLPQHCERRRNSERSQQVNSCASARSAILHEQAQTLRARLWQEREAFDMKWCLDSGILAISIMTCHDLDYILENNVIGNGL